ncbi:DUF29 domain-containing protein [Rugamonas sp. A1-17]|nr:DUF29 domain-containing protein [Rugamonas sp. A1-17]
MSNLYEDDIIAWSEQQAALLRRGQWSELDIDNIAEEIEDMNISHGHQLAHRLAILMAHLLKWKYQSDRRGASWKNTIRNQRDKIDKLLTPMPSLRRLLEDPEWDQEVWDDAVDLAGREANLTGLPKVREWDFGQILSTDYFPS